MAKNLLIMHMSLACPRGRTPGHPGEHWDCQVNITYKKAYFASHSVLWYIIFRFYCNLYDWLDLLYLNVNKDYKSTHVMNWAAELREE